MNASSKLQSMPPEWVARIYWAAATGDPTELHHLVATMPVPDAELAHHLSDLVAQLQFEAVMELTQFTPRSRQRPNGKL